MKFFLSSISGFLLGMTALGLQASAAWAGDTQRPTAPTPNSATAPISSQSLTRGRPANDYSPGRRFFVEFRARNAASYGHVYVMYGEANSRQEIINSHIAGFFPAGDRRDCINCSVFNWTIGHIIFVPSEIGASDGDLEEKYVLARYRVWIDAAQYRKLVVYLKQRQAEKELWNALFKNCVDFGRDVARFINLRVPFFILTSPENFVTSLREANGLSKEQMPLKDAARSAAVNSAPIASSPSLAKKRGDVTPPTAKPLL